MTAQLTTYIEAAQMTPYIELGLCALLAITLVYCIILERRLNTVRRGQEALKGVIGELNTSIAAAATSIRMLKAAAGEAANTLDERLALARKLTDELASKSATVERRAERMDRTPVPASQSVPLSPAPAIKPAPRASVHADRNLPSGSIMNRLDALRAAR
jgi:hypothetical protein